MADVGLAILVILLVVGGAISWSEAVARRDKGWKGLE